ncbi:MULTISPECIES: LPXTG cell wall anchor domain-containing protein [Bifidobacterium]|uniref:LPXTG cell wall anchor domain-containing protein n=1 Tax=Bifidobacterium TaxID=1678 RepID=UPI0018DDB4FD|nr:MULTISPECIES: LPXTG cell wall anchor domain-containing protein [Bifidobacterium]MBH9980038.1 LPXTG cell wall anchor domain-containing protein [Bifidobacterium asteroides]MBI0099492.1 LPXTG cell wall anchor domain-containing protein [Bifidobacterium sp. W8114]
MNKHRWIGLLTALAALAALAGPATPAIAGGGSGHAGGRPVAPGDENIQIWQGWAYKDDEQGAFGGYAIGSIDKAFSQLGVVDKGNANTARVKRQALDEANGNCQARFNEAHADQSGQGHCRVTGVGVVATYRGSQRIFDGISVAIHKYWMDNWRSQVANTTFSNRGVTYRTSDSFWDQSNDNLDKFADEYAGNEKGISLVVIMLNDYEPKPADLPPDPPDKQVGRGTSADGMTNRTHIVTGTGRGGRELTFSDVFDPQGKQYRISGQHVRDQTSGEDLTDKFVFNTAEGDRPPGERATATWKGGALPEEHRWAWQLDVTVEQPETGLILDQGAVHWKGAARQVDQSTPERRTPTWRPKPDKSWILRDAATGVWKSVVDPQWSNKTGADGHVFLDGDRVGSVVNATVEAHLVEAPKVFALTDDWSAADYLVDQDGAGAIRIFVAKARADADGHYRHSSVGDIVAMGRDVTDRFQVSVSGTRARAQAKSGWLNGLKGMEDPMQVTMLVPFTVRFANGGGASQVRNDLGGTPDQELTFCKAPDGHGNQGGALTNSGSQTVNTQSVQTNKPGICGYLPPVRKDVISEAGQGGEQASVDGKVVFPGQRLEYQLDTQPSLPDSLAYPVKSIILTDVYDRWFLPDKQTLEVTDLQSGDVIAKTGYATKWKDKDHGLRVTITDSARISQWRAGSNPRIRLRFEGRVDPKAPTDHQVDNHWVLALNNSLTPSNQVSNPPADFHPSKSDVSAHDPGISIDGKVLFVGDRGVYRISLDARRRDTAYPVWRLGMTDAYDARHLDIDPKSIEVLGSDGRDYTKAFNIQVADGIVLVFAKTVDTYVPATGETLKGDPQPADLAAYAADRGHNPLREPAIDQGLLGRTYDLVLPYTVIRAEPGHVVRNQATQIVNDLHKATNVVANPVKPLNPAKDVVVAVGGGSAHGGSIYRDRLFLYRLDSSLLPAGRAYPQVKTWRIEDRLDPTVDRFTGHWAVYATQDLYENGRILIHHGRIMAGSDMSADIHGGPLFTMTEDPAGLVKVEATPRYLALVSASGDRPVGWRAYLQCRRLKKVERHENRFTEFYQDKTLVSNTVWTGTPDMTPALHIEKFDQAGGMPKGDRDQPEQALRTRDDVPIVFRITNDSPRDPGDGTGAVFLARQLHLEDQTVVGRGRVTGVRYPDNWSTLMLRPGQSVDVHATVTGISGRHTDRARVIGSPLVPCPVDDAAALPEREDADRASLQPNSQGVMVDGRLLCSDRAVRSNSDDWNALEEALPKTGAAVALPLAILAAAVMIGSLLSGLVRRVSKSPKGRR